LNRPYRLLALLPVLGILLAPWCANRVEPRIAGLPFMLAWIAACVLCTSLVMWYILRRDEAYEAREADTVPGDMPR
jgi:hypothetical protein